MAETVTSAEGQELGRRVDALKKDIAAVAGLAKEKVVSDTTAWVKEHPTAAVGIVAGLAAAVGFALGLLVGRGRG